MSHPGIIEVRNLFSKAEKICDARAKERLVLSALDILESIVEDEPSEKDLEVLANLKKALARSVVKQIDSMNLQSNETLELLISVLVKFHKEVMDLLDSDQVFKDRLNRIMDQYREEFEFFRRWAERSKLNRSE